MCDLAILGGGGGEVQLVELLRRGVGYHSDVGPLHGGGRQVPRLEERRGARGQRLLLLYCRAALTKQTKRSCTVYRRMFFYLSNYLFILSHRYSTHFALKPSISELPSVTLFSYTVPLTIMPLQTLMVYFITDCLGYTDKKNFPIYQEIQIND